MRWVVIRQPVNIDGKVFRELEFIPAELEAKMEKTHKNACLRVPDSLAPAAEKPALPPVLSIAPGPSVTGANA